MASSIGCLQNQPTKCTNNHQKCIHYSTDMIFHVIKKALYVYTRRMFTTLSCDLLHAKQKPGGILCKTVLHGPNQAP